MSKASVVVFLAQPNQDLLKKTLDAVSKNAVKTFLYTSTLLIYKSGENEKKEEDQLSPITEYAKNKLEEEKIIFNFKNNYPNINVIVARLGNVYGDIKNRGFIGLVFEQLFEKSEKKEIVVAGDGTQIRDFVFVDDVARALSKLLLNNEKCDEINISTGIGTTLLQIIQHIEEITKKKVIYHLGPKAIEADSIIGDNTKLRMFVKWSPDTPLKDGLRKTYERYMLNVSINK